MFSPIWGEAPTVQIETKICMAGKLADAITCAKFQDEIFRGYDFTGEGVEFPIFLLIFAWALQQCSATALPETSFGLIRLIILLSKINLIIIKRRWFRYHSGLSAINTM